MVEAGGGVNGDTSTDTVTVGGHQQPQNTQSSESQLFRSPRADHLQHEQVGVADSQQHEDTNNARSAAGTLSNDGASRQRSDQMQFMNGMTRPSNNMYTRINNLDSSQFDVSMTDTHHLHLDSARTSTHSYTNSTTEPFPDVSNLDSWAPARSSIDTTQGQDTRPNTSALSGFIDNTHQAAPLSAPAQSYPATSSYMQTAGHSMTMPELPSAMFDDDLTFLEDILLPEFIVNATGFTTPIPGAFDQAAGQPVPTRNEPDISEPRLFTSLPYPFERSTDAPRPHVFDISPADVDQFQKDILHNGQLTDFPFPRRSRILRCLSAYFDSVDLHVPIIQHATFSLCGTNPALVLAVLALGATITREYSFAESAYGAACRLLDYKIKQDSHAPSSFEFWPVQASLLCAHYGAFCDNETFTLRSQMQLNRVSTMLKLGLNDLLAKRLEPRQDWNTWSFIETFSRLASWSCSMSAILLSYDQNFQTSTQHHLQNVPLPLDEDLWRARSAQEWSSLGGAPHQHSNISFLTFAESLFQGEPILEKVSPLALFSLVGWILLYICNHERMKISVGSLDIFETDFTSKIDKGLGAWETLTRRHLRTGQVMFAHISPLISDSLPLLGSAYYHLYVGEELRTLKEMAADPAMVNGSPAAHSFPEFNSRPLVYKAVRYAANSWLVRTKLGISHFLQSPDVYGAHGPIGAYESALVLSWWLTVGQSVQTPQGLAKDDTVPGRALKEVLTEVFGELEDQDISCKDEAARATAPLSFCRQIMDNSVFTYQSRFIAKMIHGSEVAEHSSRESCWVIVKGQVYDITGYLDQHPGGSTILLQYGGKDATAIYEPNHPEGIIDRTLPKDKHLGPVDPSTVATVAVPQVLPEQATTARIPLSHCYSLDDIEDAAQRIIPEGPWTYFHSAADSLGSLANNRDDWKKITLRPRIMRDVEHVNMERTMLGQKSRLPFFIAPAARAKLVHKDGELCFAWSAAKTGIPYCSSTFSTIPHADLAKCMASERTSSQYGALFFQLYMTAERSQTIELIVKARELRFAALCITVDTPVVGKREEDERYRAKLATASGESYFSTKWTWTLENEGRVPHRGHHTAKLNWKDLVWIRDAWQNHGPIVLKGIQSAEDAALAYEHGIDGIYLSNHGGRQCDDAPSAIRTLLEIRRFHPHLLGKMEIYVDGWVRRGADVIKALCLGATGVAVGRPFMYAVSMGTEGVLKVIELLSEEIETTMRCMGVTSLDELNPSYVNTKRLEWELPDSLDFGSEPSRPVATKAKL
ncbi:hypothetical protein LTR13_005345 [Exophiala sideris]|nr:hypothetical protein LTR13_005345 [Exophiala sideris]